MSKAKRVRSERAAREALEKEQMRLDPRLRNARVSHVPGRPRRRVGDELQVLSRVELPDGRVVWYAAPQIGAFNLVEAKRLRDDAEPRRQAILDTLVDRPTPGEYKPADAGEVLDVLSALAVAVTFSFMAVESLANEIIEGLPKGTTWPGRKDEELDPAGMVRWLSITDKLQKVIPRLTDVKRLPRGQRMWQRFIALKDLRDDLIHAKNRDAHTPGDTPAYGRLLAGEAATCVEDAFAVCDSISPGYFPLNVREALGVHDRTLPASGTCTGQRRPARAGWPTRGGRSPSRRSPPGPRGCCFRRWWPGARRTPPPAPQA